MPADLTFDGVFPEAWLQTRVKLLPEARSLVRSVLEAVRSMPVTVLSIPANAGAMRSTIVLHSQLAEEAGDHTDARRWRDALRAITHSADSITRNDSTLLQSHEH